MAHNVWTAKLSTAEAIGFDADFVSQELTTGTFRKLVAETKSEHARALHLVKATPRKPGK